VTYQKEYGADVFEMKTDAFEGIDSKKKVILVDDLLATGGSIGAAKKLIEMLGMEVVDCVFIFDVPDFYEAVKEKLMGGRWYAMVQL